MALGIAFLFPHLEPSVPLTYNYHLLCIIFPKLQAVGRLIMHYISKTVSSWKVGRPLLAPLLKTADMNQNESAKRDRGKASHGQNNQVGNLCRVTYIY